MSEHTPSNTNIYSALDATIRSLRKIAHEKNIAIIMPKSHVEFNEYCRRDAEHTLKFYEEYNRCDNLRRIKERRAKRHVSRRERSAQPKRRKMYLGKRGVSSKETVRLLERDNNCLSVIKSRPRSSSMGICINPSNGYFDRAI